MLSESLFTSEFFQSASGDSYMQICTRAGYFRSTRHPGSFEGMHEFIYARSCMETLSRLNALVPATVVDHEKEKVSWCGSLCLILNDQHPALPCKSSLGGLSCSQRCWGEYDITAWCLHAYEPVCAHRLMLWSFNHG